MPAIELTIPSEEQGSRLDAALARLIPEHSRSSLQTLIERDEVTVDGEFSKSKRTLLGGELVTVHLPDPNQQLLPNETPLNTLYEDGVIRVLNKPSGVVVHPNSLDETDSIVQRLLSYDPSIQDVLYDPESEVSKLRPGIIHRLDKDTSGVLVTAVTKEALQAVSQQFHNHEAKKTYLVLLSGTLLKEEDVHTGMLRKSGKENVMGVTPAGQGRDAVSHFRPLQVMQLPDRRTITLAECKIDTGRTHQIRVHAKFLGHPVLGDVLYANKTSLSITGRLGVTRQLLHAYKLSLTHPKSDELMTFTAPLPEDMRHIMADLAPEALKVLAL